MLTFKIAYTAFVLLVVAIWWRHYSWRNFLWFSDIAFIGAVPALWLQSSALASVLAVAVLVPEILWNVDFVARLALRRRITGLTDYMFEPDCCVACRCFTCRCLWYCCGWCASTGTTRGRAWQAPSCWLRSCCRGAARSARLNATSTGPMASVRAGRRCRRRPT